MKIIYEEGRRALSDLRRPSWKTLKTPRPASGLAPLLLLLLILLASSSSPSCPSERRLQICHAGAILFLDIHGLGPWVLVSLPLLVEMSSRFGGLFAARGVWSVVAVLAASANVRAATVQRSGNMYGTGVRLRGHGPDCGPSVFAW